MISCQNCGHENRAESNFCSHCGTKLPLDVEAGEAAAPQAAEAPPDAPKELAGGRYVISRYLGEGGRKRVYLAHDTLLDRDVAVGLVKTSGLDPEARARVLRGAQAMARLGRRSWETTSSRSSPSTSAPSRSSRAGTRRRFRRSSRISSCGCSPKSPSSDRRRRRSVSGCGRSRRCRSTSECARRRT